MHSKDLHDLIQSGARPVVTFRKGVEEGEGYLEAGMRGRITGSRTSGDGVFSLTVDLNEFGEFNTAFETANYYNNQGMPVLTAREAGFYPKDGIDQLYVSENLDPYLEVLSDNQTELHQRYLSARKPNETYVEWLERALLAAESVHDW